MQDDSQRAHSMFELEAIRRLLSHPSLVRGRSKGGPTSWAVRGVDPSLLPEGVEATTYGAVDSKEGPFDCIVFTTMEGTPGVEEMKSLANQLREGGRVVTVGLWSERGYDATSDTPGAKSDPTDYPSRCSFEVNLAEAGYRVDRELEIRVEAPIESRELEGHAYVLSRDGHYIRCCEPSDSEPILSLFEKSFYHQRPAEHWHWKYECNPWGNRRISLAFDSSNDELVGQYCAYLVPFIRHGDDAPTRYLCHQVGDTMTAQRVRNVGRGPTSLLARSARHFYARFCHEQVSYNYGFNTGNIRKFSKRFVGALDVQPAPYLTLPLPNPTPGPSEPHSRSASTSLLNRALDRLGIRNTNQSSTVRVERVSRVDDHFDRLLEQTLPVYQLLVERSSQYLDWRYLTAPDVDYRLYAAWRGDRLVGWSVFRSRDQRLVWGDALFLREEAGAASDILARAIQDAPESEEIAAWFSDRPGWWREHLRQLGFHSRDEPDDLAMVVVPFMLENPVEILRDELYLTMGDGDLF